jgi:hypothetical protein
MRKIKGRVNMDITFFIGLLLGVGLMGYFIFWKPKK